MTRTLNSSAPTPISPVITLFVLRASSANFFNPSLPTKTETRVEVLSNEFHIDEFINVDWPSRLAEWKVAGILAMAAYGAPYSRIEKDCKVYPMTISKTLKWFHKVAGVGEPKETFAPQC